jgi:hypothetical protein
MGAVVWGLWYQGGEVTTADWTAETLPSWLDSIWQGIARPKGLWLFGVSVFIKSWREVPTILVMRLRIWRRVCAGLDVPGCARGFNPSVRREL